MIASNQTLSIAKQNEQLLVPNWGVVKDITEEAQGISTIWLELLDEKLKENYAFTAGQFNMLYLPGYGEAAISISSDPDRRNLIGHTVRYVGNVTRAVERLRLGHSIGIRGPFGRPWPLETYRGCDIILTAGGIGLAPLRPVIYRIINHRAHFGKVIVLYGARTPADLLYVNEYQQWEQHDIQVMTTVDRADESWQGQVGVVPMLFYRTSLDTENTVVFSCGPEIMMRFVVFEGLARRIKADRIYLSLERNMKCGQGLCGHCQYGPYFVCKDGPVFSYQQLEPQFNLEDL